MALSNAKNATLLINIKKNENIAHWENSFNIGLYLITMIKL